MEETAVIRKGTNTIEFHALQKSAKDTKRENNANTRPASRVRQHQRKAKRTKRRGQTGKRTNNGNDSKSKRKEHQPEAQPLTG